MKIGFDAFPVINSSGGVARYARGLLNALLDLGSGDSFIGYVPFGASSRLNWPCIKEHVSLRYVESRQLSLSRRGLIDDLDLYHGTNFKLQTAGRFGTVLTVHDLWLDRHPEYSKKLFGQRFSFYRTRRRTRQATQVIAVSRFTAEEIQDLYGVSAQKISVIHHGVSSEFFPDHNESRWLELRERIGLPGSPYILFVGGANPRKNHRVLFQAFAHQSFIRENYVLLVVGNPTHKFATIRDTSLKLGIGNKVFCAGMVSAQELCLLYSNAEAFVFPSKYEGFGFPVLEAMACGVPVITSSLSALPEVAGDAAVFVNPESEEELTHAMFQVLQDSSLQDNLRKKGFERIKQFQWEQTAEQTLKVYQRVCQ